jgi:thioredoxin 1
MGVNGILDPEPPKIMVLTDNGKPRSKHITNMKPTTLTQENFDTTLKTAAKPVLVDFWAEWCGHCKMIAPVLEKLSAEQQGKALIAKVNIDESPELASRFGITAIPTFVVFKNGHPVKRLQGAQSKPTLAASIAEAA